MSHASLCSVVQAFARAFFSERDFVPERVSYIGSQSGISRARARRVRHNMRELNTSANDKSSQWPMEADPWERVTASRNAGSNVLAGPRFDQGAVHGEVLVRHQALRPLDDVLQEAPRDRLIQQPVASLRERGRIPYRSSIVRPTNQRNSRLQSSCAISNRSLQIE